MRVEDDFSSPPRNDALLLFDKRKNGRELLNKQKKKGPFSGKTIVGSGRRDVRILSCPVLRAMALNPLGNGEQCVLHCMQSNGDFRVQRGPRHKSVQVKGIPGLRTRATTEVHHFFY